MIAIIDYGMGNLRSVEKALRSVGADVCITNDKDVIRRADKLILPGVGAVKDAIFELRRTGLDALIIEQCASGKPLLGICLGMQLLMSASYEDGKYECLGLIDGEVIKFNEGLKVPHMGWNECTKVQSHPIWDDIDKLLVYFVHSYYVQCDPCYRGATTDYGISFTSVVIKDNIIGMQFHPEKSGDIGAKILENFVLKV